MDKLNEILNDIKILYFSDIDNDIKYEKASLLWKLYYKVSKENNIDLEEVDNLRMILENECYSIYQEPKYEKVDVDSVMSAINHLEEVLYKNKVGLVDGISFNEANVILDYVIYKVREIYSNLGVDIYNNSLNGYCELGQSLSIRFLENLGLKVTKNKASECFNYHLNHCFGTVTFPVLINNKPEEKKFLIDTTYRQFFTSIRCNEGMYYKNDELINSPDPGYFVKNKEFAKQLLKDGYILLDENTAFSYGEPFYLSSLEKINIDNKDKIDYFEKIINNNGDYVLGVDELEGLEIKIPNKIGGKGRL